MTATVPEVGGAKRSRTPLYWWLLRLKYVKPNSWQRGVLAEGSLALALLLVLADVASAWTLLVFPLAVAAVVKAHDLLTGLLVGAGDGTPVNDDQSDEPPDPT